MRPALSFVDICHDIRYIAVKDSAQFVDSMCRNILTPLDCIIIRLGKAQLEQAVGSNSFFLHSHKQGFIAYHNVITCTFIPAG